MCSKIVLWHMLIDLLCPRVNPVHTDLTYTCRKRDSSSACDYCQHKGHWKSECPALKGKAKFSGNEQVKTAPLAAPVVPSHQLVVQPKGHVDVMCPSLCVCRMADFGLFNVC